MQHQPFHHRQLDHRCRRLQRRLPRAVRPGRFREMSQMTDEEHAVFLERAKNAASGGAFLVGKHQTWCSLSGQEWTAYVGT